jgi:hypothetical protein
LKFLLEICKLGFKLAKHSPGARNFFLAELPALLDVSMQFYHNRQNHLSLAISIVSGGRLALAIHVMLTDIASPVVQSCSLLGSSATTRRAASQSDGYSGNDSSDASSPAIGSVSPRAGFDVPHSLYGHLLFSPLNKIIFFSNLSVPISKARKILFVKSPRLAGLLRR